MTSPSEARKALRGYYRGELRAAKAAVKRLERLVIDTDPELARELGLADAPTKPRKASSETYASAMKRTGTPLSKILEATAPLALLQRHPWTAANILDPDEWLAQQQLKAPGALSDDELRGELVKALLWMGSKGKAVAGRRDAGKFLASWISRYLERRRPGSPTQPGLFQGGKQPARMMDYDDDDTRKGVTGKARH